MAPKPRDAETTADVTPEQAAAEIPGEQPELPRSSIPEVAPESGRSPRSERSSGAPRSRRRSSAPPPPKATSKLPFAVAAAVIIFMFVAGAKRAMREEQTDAKPNAASPLSVVEHSPAEKPLAAPVPSPAAPPAAMAPAEPPAADTVAPATSAAETAPPAASAPEPSAEPARTGDTIPVLLRSSISGARFYRHGKQVGINSVIVDLAPGEKRAFEVDLPGYVSRKVVVDGSRSEVVVVLPRISDAPDPGHAGTDNTAGGAPQGDSPP